MIMAPIYGREFAKTCRRHKSPAPCRWPQLLRLLALATLAAACVFVTLAPERATAETHSVLAAIAAL
jgi:hypothetical protein